MHIYVNICIYVYIHTMYALLEGRDDAVFPKV